jgi:hypothetical protein
MEVLYYSEAQHELLKKNGTDAGILLFSQSHQPLFWTETRSDLIQQGVDCQQQYESISDILASHWPDAVELYRHPSEIHPSYIRLVELHSRGSGYVDALVLTEAGRIYCLQHDLEPTLEAIQAVAQKSKKK